MTRFRYGAKMAEGCFLFLLFLLIFSIRPQAAPSGYTISIEKERISIQR